MSTEVSTTIEPVEPGDFHLVDEPMFAKVYIATVVIGAYQPRQTFIDETLQELAASIKEYGINQPLLFRPAPGNPEMLELVAGERRFRAAILAGLTWVPGMVKNMTDEEAAAFRLVENMQREDVPPLEEAQGIRRLMDDFGMSVETIAEKTGKKKGVIYASLKLLNLSPAAQEIVKDKHIAASTALLVARIPVPALQEQAIAEIAENDGAAEPMSHRAAKQHIEDRYMLDMSQATFPLDDAKLVKDCSACTTCPKRTTNSPEDFPGVSADLCTDPDCFSAKVEANHKAILAVALKRKIPVFAFRGDADKDFPQSEFVSGVTARMYQFTRLVDLSSKLLCDSDLPASAYPPPVAYYMLDGKPEPLYAKTAIQEALEKAGLALTEEQEEARYAEQKQQREHVEKEKKKKEASDPAAVRRKLLEEINTKIADAYNAFHLDLFNEIKEQVAPDILLPIYRALALYSSGMAARSWELGFSQSSDESYSVDFEDTEAVAEMLESASDEDVCRLNLDTVLSNIPRVYPGDIEGSLIKCQDEFEEFQQQHYETLSKIGSICGIDIGLLRDKHLAQPLADLAKATNPIEQEPAKEEPPASGKTQKKQPAKPKKKAAADTPNPAWPFPTSQPA